jgi:hypothetical protein
MMRSEGAGSGSVTAKVTFIEETHRGERVVRECVLTDDSTKRLTKGRAAKLLARAYPELKLTDKVLLIDTNRGWSVTKSIQPRKNVWLRVYIAPISH